MCGNYYLGADPILVHGITNLTHQIDCFPNLLDLFHISIRERAPKEVGKEKAFSKNYLEGQQTFCV